MLSKDRDAISTSVLRNGETERAAPETPTEERRRKKEERGRQRELLHSSGNSLYHYHRS